MTNRKFGYIINLAWCFTKNRIMINAIKTNLKVVGEMRNILFDLLKTNENTSLTKNVSSMCLSDVILPALITKS